MTDVTMHPTVGETLISARLCMLQSKRLILATLERRLRQRPVDALRARVDRLRIETENAQRSYTGSLLEWGSPATPGYWAVAYKELVETANRLSMRLRGAAVDMPAPERYELAAEVEMLEELMGEWRKSMRAAVAFVA